MSQVALVLAVSVLLGAVGPLGDSTSDDDTSGDPVVVTRLALQAAKTKAAAQPRAPLIAREEFLRFQEIVDVRLSPDGRYVSFFRRTEQSVDLILQEVSSGVQTRIVADLQRAEAVWSGDGSRLWLADEQGLSVIESADLSAKRILKWDVRRAQRFWAVDESALQYAIIHERVAERGVERHRYLSVDAQCQTRLLYESELPLRSALLNADGDLAFTAAFDGPRYETVIREHSAAGPRELLRSDTVLEECRLVGYNRAEQTLWLLLRHDEDKLALRRWQRKSGGWETIHRDPALLADAHALLWCAAREDWLAIAYYGARLCWHGNDSTLSAQLAALQEQLPEANLQLSATADGSLWLVHAQQGELALDGHYVYRPEDNQLQRLFEQQASVKSPPSPGAVLHPLTYRASDGMLLHGYVVLPAGRAPDSVPLIAWLHGGPIERMYDRYNGGIQLLVNRGYAVFIPNFRASAGYGLEYVLSAQGDVGNGRVLADIIDGLDFLLAEGIGDRQRQAVAGMSFGGYSSLLALSHHPARFRFAFAGTPPTDYGWTKQWQAEHDSVASRPMAPPLSLQFTQLGFRYEDAAWREQMQRESPLAALPAVQAPAYIWAGAHDKRVPLKSIVHYVGEARRLDKPLSLLIDPDAGHGPESALGTEASLYLIELAAHRHLGGGLSPVSPELQEFLRRNVRIDVDAQR
ncbi:MAG: prolyl oligopeptidase family serine peptidase [Planctomycetota bacterium]